MTAPGPDLIRAVRAGCDTAQTAAYGNGWRGCSWPGCECVARPHAIRAALAELAEPSAEMLVAVPNYRNLAEHCWRAMMRKVLGESPK